MAPHALFLAVAVGVACGTFEHDSQETEECEFMQFKSNQSKKLGFCFPNPANPLSFFRLCPWQKAIFCTGMRKVCNTAFEEAATSIIECTEAAGEADALCLSLIEQPELIPICVSLMTGGIEAACVEVVNKGVSFGAGKCADACGCTCPNKRIDLGAACTGGDNTCCEDGLVCGKWDNSDENYQCCSNYNVVNGLAWCINDFGGACSDGNNYNCVAGAACGRYNNDGHAYQCCGNHHNYGGVTWCTNAAGNACSDGVNENCMPGLTCGKWLESSSGYACCSNYTMRGGVIHCTSVPLPQ